MFAIPGSQGRALTKLTGACVMGVCVYAGVGWVYEGVMIITRLQGTKGLFCYACFHGGEPTIALTSFSDVVLDPIHMCFHTHICACVCVRYYFTHCVSVSLELTGVLGRRG